MGREGGDVREGRGRGKGKGGRGKGKGEGDVYTVQGDWLPCLLVQPLLMQCVLVHSDSRFE